MHSGETEDISSAYIRICETIRNLENASDKAVNSMLEEEVESLESVVRKTLLILPQDYRFYYVCVLKNREFVE